MSVQSVTVGVLALQGAFALHQPHIEAAGGRYKEIHRNQDLHGIDALILPGGESAVQLKLLDILQMTEALRATILRVPTWGICAGAILMASSVSHPAQSSLRVIDFDIVRNAYGRQRESHTETIDGFEVSFIRAPKIARCGPHVQRRRETEGFATWVEQDLHTATTFHPETNLKTPSPWHRQLVERAIRHCGA